jgi:hypothetical protein
VPQQKTGFFERGATLGVRQIVHVVALIGQHATITIEVTDRGLTRDDVFSPGLRLGALRGVS